MRHNEILTALQNLTGQKPKQKELAEVLGVGIGIIGKRATRNSEYPLNDLIKLDNFYGSEFSYSEEVQEYIDKLASDWAEKQKQSILTPKVKEVLMSYYNQGIDLNWLITGKGNKYRASEFGQAKDELAQRMEKMENALRNAGILTD